MTITSICFACREDTLNGKLLPIWSEIFWFGARFGVDPVGRCHPQYLSPRAHRKLSQPGAFDGLRIHTDELREVIAPIATGTLSHAVVSHGYTLRL